MDTGEGCLHLSIVSIDYMKHIAVMLYLWRSAMRVYDTCIFDPHVGALQRHGGPSRTVLLYQWSPTFQDGICRASPVSTLLLERVQLKATQGGRPLSVRTKCWTSLTRKTRYLRMGWTALRPVSGHLQACAYQQFVQVPSSKYKMHFLPV